LPQSGAPFAAGTEIMHKEARMATKDTRKMGLKESRKFSDEVRKVLKYRGNRLDAASRKSCEEGLLTLLTALGAAKTDKSPENLAAVDDATTALTGLLKPHEDKLKNASGREYVEAIGIALVLALLVRIFVFEAFHIPTGSMIPTVNISDQMFVNKYKYGLRIPFTHYDILPGTTPSRGEVVVFDYPVPGKNYGQAFLKRVIGLPGDRIKLENNVLQINGRPVRTKVVTDEADCADDNLAGCLCERQVETLGRVSYTTQHISRSRPGSGQICRNDPNWPVNNPMAFGSPAENPDFPEVVVPAGHVFCMGDNRDNSSDGRYWGFVPIENLRGKAVLFWWPLTKLFRMVR